jgi:hypothetical protein
VTLSIRIGTSPQSRSGTAPIRTAHEHGTLGA